MSEEEKNLVEEQEMDWDSPIEAQIGDTNLPPAGDYGFNVEEFEKTFSKAGKKMAKITIKLDRDGQFWKVTDYLVLTESMAWKLAQFFECLSLKKKGEELKKMPWDKVLGATGRVKIKHEEYNGDQYCKVDRYLPSAASKAQTAPEKKSSKKKAPEEDLPFEV